MVRALHPPGRAIAHPVDLGPEIIEEYGDRPVTLSTVLPMA